MAYGWAAVFGNQVLLEHSCIHLLYLLSMAIFTLQQSSSCNRDHIAYELKIFTACSLTEKVCQPRKENRGADKYHNMIIVNIEAYYT